MFELTDKPISPPTIASNDAGGFVSFEGRVRNHANGRRVVVLEYEAYPELASKEGDALAREAAALYDLNTVRIVHRTGRLDVGEVAVWIGVGASHRREAFGGCEWIIDQLKVRVPIWKREFFDDGDSGWVGADENVANPVLEQALSARQRALSEVGDDGQDRLRGAKVLLVGVGGLGCGCLPYLASAGVGTIGLVDSDTVDLSNLHRQVIYKSSDVGRSKVERASSFAQKLNPTITLRAHQETLSETNVEKHVSGYDLVVDGTDSLQTKFLLNRVCRKANVPLVTASVHRFEGHLMSVAPDGPCLQCLFPSVPPERCVGTCSETGILGVVPGCLGVLQANEVLKWILGFGTPLSQHVCIVDMRTGTTELISRERLETCPVCANRHPEELNEFVVPSLERAANMFSAFTIIDVREANEEPVLSVPHRRIPMSSLDISGIEGPIIFVCSSGARSLRAVFRARSLGRTDTYSLAGGLEPQTQDGHIR